jgi:dTDP-glucose pyrophosphorylase
MFFIIVKEIDSQLEVTVIKNKIISFLIDKQDEIDSYAYAITQALDFFDNCEVSVFTSNIFVTNTIKEWMDTMREIHESWRILFEKQQEKNITLYAYTAYSNFL